MIPTKNKFFPLSSKLCPRYSQGCRQDGIQVIAPGDHCSKPGSPVFSAVFWDVRCPLIPCEEKRVATMASDQWWQYERAFNAQNKIVYL